MMSPGHAISGAASGYTACLIYSAATGYQWPWLVPHAVAVVVAGWALFPDCDSQKSTVSTSLGWITQSFHHLVCITAAAVYHATRTESDPADKPRIHRGISHTWPGALFMGLLVAALVAAFPRYATPAVLAFSLHLGLRGLAIPKSAHGQPKGNIAGRFITNRGYVLMRLVPQPGRIFNWMVRKSSRMVGFSGKWVRTSSIIVCGVLAWLVTSATPELRTEWVAALGWCVVQGMLVHCAGDSVTESGICWHFPFVHKASGKRWHESKIPPITMPDWVPIFSGRVYKPAFRTGRAFEIVVMYPLCIAACLLAAPGGLALLVQATNMMTAWRGATAGAVALPFAPWPMTPPPPPAPGASTPVAMLPAQ